MLRICLAAIEGAILMGKFQDYLPKSTTSAATIYSTKLRSITSDAQSSNYAPMPTGATP